MEQPEIDEPKHRRVEINEICHDSVIHVRSRGWLEITMVLDMKYKIKKKKENYLVSSLMVHKNSDRLSSNFHLIINSLNGDEDLTQSFSGNDVMHELYSESPA